MLVGPTYGRFRSRGLTKPVILVARAPNILQAGLRCIQDYASLNPTHGVSPGVY